MPLPINPRRGDDIAAVVAAYDKANPFTQLPRSASRVLAAMFATSDVCQRSLQEGFDRKRLPTTLRRLVQAGFLSKEPGSGAVSDTYWLHLPPLVRA